MNLRQTQKQQGNCHSHCNEILTFEFFYAQNYRSIALLLQVALPLILFGHSTTTLHLKGGTNAEMAPQIDFTTEIFRPNLEQFGATFDFTLERRG